MRTIIMVLLILPLFIGSAYAEDFISYAAEEFGANKLEQMLSESEKDIVGKLNFDGNYDVGAAFSRLWKSFVAKLVVEIKENLSFCTGIVALALMCALCISISIKPEIINLIEIVCCGSVAVLLFGGVESIVNDTISSMYRLSDYSKAALPVIFSASAASGAVSSSAAKFAGVSFALDVLMSISQRLILPLIYSYISLMLSSVIFNNPIVSTVQKMCKWAAATMMTGMTLAFTTYISMIGAIGNAVDAASVKTARSVISSLLPVVGGMISDASAMILSAAGVVKSCAGVFGLITVIVICAGPFAVLSVKLFLFKGVSAVAESIDNKRLTQLMSGFASVMSLLMALLGCCGIMLFISLTAGMKAVLI